VFPHHAEIEVAGHERFDHRQRRRIVAVVGGQVVAGVGCEALECLVVDHVLRDGRIAGSPRLPPDGNLHRLARLCAHDGRRGEGHGCGSGGGDEAAARCGVATVVDAHV
jgi:hypothetical protein